MRQRRSPCAGSQDGNIFHVRSFCYLLLAGSSGQRGRGLKSSGSDRPARKCSIPAHATMAPLSVHKFIGAAAKDSLYFFARFSKA